MVHALQLKQQQQGWLSYLNHISIDVMIDELPRVHSDALQLKQQAMLLIDFNQPSLQPPVLSSELLLIDQLRRVHQDVLRQHGRQCCYSWPLSHHCNLRCCRVSYC